MPVTKLLEQIKVLQGVEIIMFMTEGMVQKMLLTHATLKYCYGTA